MIKPGPSVLLSGCALLGAASAMAADGDLDTTFGTGGFVLDSSVRGNYPGLAVQADGRLVTCDAGIALNNQSYDFYVRRYEANGAPDTTFGTNGLATVGFVDGSNSFDDACGAVAVQGDGKIVLAGVRETPGFPLPTYAQFAVARLDANGALDPAFGAGTGRVSFAFTGFDGGSQATSVLIDAQGRILVAGGAYTQTNEDFAIARLLSDGTIDATFGTEGQVTCDFAMYDIVDAIALDASQRILATGFAGNDAVVVRLLPDGARDDAFGIGGVASANLDTSLSRGGFSRGLVVDHDGRIVLAGAYGGVDGSVTFEDMMAARFLADGSLDASFGTAGIATVAFDRADAGGGVDEAFAIAETVDGRLVLAGQAEYGNSGNSLAAVARLDEQGALDGTFGLGGKNVFPFGAGNPDTDTQWLANLALQGGRIVATGGTSGSASGDVIVRLENDRIFAAAFD